MANLYGVATPNPLPVGAFTIGGADIVTGVGVETNVIAITVNNPTVNGWYYPNFGGWLAISLGATPPTAIFIGYRLGAGSDLSNLQVSPAALVASATVIQPLTLAGTALIVSNPSGINVFNISVQTAGQSATVRTVGSFGQCGWVRSTDQ